MHSCYILSHSLLLLSIHSLIGWIRNDSLNFWLLILSILSLKACEPQVGQRHEDVERKREYYHIIIFLKEVETLHQERRGQVKSIAMNTSTASSSTSPDLITSSIPINQSSVFIKVSHRENNKSVPKKPKSLELLKTTTDKRKGRTWFGLTDSWHRTVERRVRSRSSLYK